MAHTAEFTGKKVEDAINEGLKTFGVTIDEVEVEIISQGGFLKKAKVRLTIEADEKYKDEPKSQIKENKVDKVTPIVKDKSKGGEAVAVKDKTSKEKPVKDKADKKKLEQKVEVAKSDDKSDKSDKVTKDIKDTKEAKDTKTFDKPINKDANDKFRSQDKFKTPKFKETENVELMAAAETSVGNYLTKTLSLMGVEAEVKRTKGLNFEIETTDNAVVGYRGETLDALQYLTRLSVNKGDERFMRVSLDSNGYRAKREVILTGLAHKMAEKCVKQGHKVVLEPMESVDRHTIHAALGDDERVFTKSEGNEPNRRVVIMVKRDKK